MREIDLDEALAIAQGLVELKVQERKAVLEEELSHIIIFRKNLSDKPTTLAQLTELVHTLPPVLAVPILTSILSDLMLSTQRI